MNSIPTKATQAHKVSVIIPLYNGERYVSEALASVLGQTLSPFEVIVVNDGSTDGSGAMLDSYADRIVRIDQENSGTAAARNAVPEYQQSVRR